MDPEARCSRCCASEHKETPDAPRPAEGGDRSAPDDGQGDEHADELLLDGDRDAKSADGL